MNREALRQHMRAQRRRLSFKQRQHAAQQLKQVLIRQPLLLKSKRVALYLANDGEIDPQPLLELLCKLGKECYLPVLDPLHKNHLWFYAYHSGDPLKPNRFGIPEPIVSTAQRFSPRFLDCVLLPLVAFDANGGRLGMGGGFYDRTFAFKQSLVVNQKTAFSTRPKLIGLAYELQKVEALELASWDIPLTAIATEAKFYRAGILTSQP